MTFYTQPNIVITLWAILAHFASYNGEFGGLKRIFIIWAGEEGKVDANFHRTRSSSSGTIKTKSICLNNYFTPDLSECCT